MASPPRMKTCVSGQFLGARTDQSIQNCSNIAYRSPSGRGRVPEFLWVYARGVGPGAAWSGGCCGGRGCRPPTSAPGPQGRHERARGAACPAVQGRSRPAGRLGRGPWARGLSVRLAGTPFYSGVGPLHVCSASVLHAFATLRALVLQAKTVFWVVGRFLLIFGRVSYPPGLF